MVNERLLFVVGAFVTDESEFINDICLDLIVVGHEGLVDGQLDVQCEIDDLLHLVY